jgi:hypothetical protein
MVSPEKNKNATRLIYKKNCLKAGQGKKCPLTTILVTLPALPLQQWPKTAAT